MFYFFVVVLSFLAFIGACCLARGIAAALSRPKDERSIILIEPIKNADTAEFQLRRAALKVMWMGRLAPDRVIALDCGLNPEGRRLCSLVCRDFPFVCLCTKAELKERISAL